jgi:acyl-CoA synthetase (AMP-forming)/AMP-acid ligase II
VSISSPESVTRIDVRSSRSAIPIVGVSPVAEPIVPDVETTVDALVRAAEDPSLGITLYEDDVPTFRSYARILEDAQRMAGALSAWGVRSRDRVLLAMPTSFDFVTSFFAIQWLGATPVPSYPPAALERFDVGFGRLVHIANAAETVLFITSAKLQPKLSDVALRAPKLRAIVSAEALLAEKVKPAPRDKRIASSRTCFVQFTSGSTGKPKGVVLTHANITSNIHAMGLACGFKKTERIASWLPLYHDMGLIGGLLTPIQWCFPLALMSPMGFIERPVRWLKMISETRATIAAAPNFGYTLCAKRVRPRDIEGLDLSSWRIAMNGAEPVHADTIKEFTDAFAPCGFKASAMFPVYGLAEASLAVTFPLPGSLPRTMRISREALAKGRVVESDDADAAAFMCCGSPLPGHTVIVADEKGRRLPAGHVGSIVVRGPSVMRGYLKDAQTTARVLQDGWLWTGDLGFRTDDGLYITGRAKDLIIIRGRNYYAEDAERVVESLAGARHGGVVVFGVHDDRARRDRVTCVCETKLRDEKKRAELILEIRARVNEEVGLPIDEVVLVAPGTIPKTSSGKRQRRQTKTLYMGKGLATRSVSKRALAGAMLRSAMGRLHLALRSRTPSA